MIIILLKPYCFIVLARSVMVCFETHADQLARSRNNKQTLCLSRSVYFGQKVQPLRSSPTSTNLVEGTYFRICEQA